MVGSSHEALYRIFQKDPALLTRSLQSVLHIPFPEPREFAAMNVDLTEIEPVERRVHTLLRAETDEGVYLLVVESQGEPDERKRGSWPYYLSYLHEKYRCEPVLIVITQNLVVRHEPKASASYIANQFKGFTSRVLREEFPHLKSRMPTLWSSSFFVASVGAVSADTVEKYINTQWERPWTKEQQEKERDKDKEGKRAPRV